MKKFGARRVARKIGGDDDEEQSASATGPSTESSPEPSSAVKRPSVKPRKSSALRSSFGPSFADDAEGPSSVIMPKRSNLSRVAIQRSAEKRSNDLPFRAGREDDEIRPSYSKGYLEELKQSTPSTPKDLSASTTDAEDGGVPLDAQALDITAKFGTNLNRYQPPTAIPTDAEIREKKERRARLAKENDFIALDDEDEEDEDDNVTHDENGRLILRPKEKYPETRLVRDDEDILEDFDDFTSDGRIALGRKAEKEAAARRKAEMASMIASAEGGHGDESSEDESEAERNAAFEVAQTRSGNYAAAAEQEEEGARPRTPPRIAPLPTMDAVVERLRKRLQEMQTARMGKVREMESLKDEKTRIGEEEVRVQTSLKETGRSTRN
ncbi:hypothetical protein H2203_004748 [Taxawa tesnikishii (nom. ined.)]|nr:hypothetical protein H2203_004748 [Dothideales sp. JES 119]